ncbi:MAG TPA: hypothetical protein VK541_03980 [Pedobacter sp.]|uniref:hypothetical protein n=1 Tax=Pedobacter sp. TaxID=1411316 RepID=UPI002CD8948A|nr:hypothetical protein [Pedobacter sp.]HMI01613.1 hypothetical protein [Pedobacter sp.]
MISFNDLNLPEQKTLEGLKIDISEVFNKNIEVWDYHIGESKYDRVQHGKLLTLQIELDGAKRVIFTQSSNLMDVVQHPNAKFPFKAKIVKHYRGFRFTSPTNEISLTKP